MTQTKFIYTLRKMMPISTFDKNGVITVILRNGVTISHNYKKNDQMIITFTEDNKSYDIDSDKHLEEILRIHLSNNNFIQPARSYCESNLKEI